MKLAEAAHALRDAQREYMANRGNDELGKIVGVRAAELDDALAHYEATRSAKKQYHIVWNHNRTEGYITDDEDDATYAESGMQCSGCVSTLAESFRDAYADEDEHEELPAQTVILEVL